MQSNRCPWRFRSCEVRPRSPSFGQIAQDDENGRLTIMVQARGDDLDRKPYLDRGVRPLLDHWHGDTLRPVQLERRRMIS